MNHFFDNLPAGSNKMRNGLPNLHKAVFLDRDGTLNVDKYVTFKPEQFELIQGVKEGLILLERWGFDLVIISNQGGIGRGKYTEEQMWLFNDLLIQALQPVELSREDIYFCPHTPEENCTCCKPQPGMLINAAKKRSINLGQSYMIGDKLSDIHAGRSAGCKITILVTTGITDDQGKHASEPDYVVDDLIEAARIIARIEGLE
jgi:D-glycero-D-manno-heptose 1,7-bisphosphate phosphatase